MQKVAEGVFDTLQRHLSVAAGHLAEVEEQVVDYSQ